jgi:hypothetical protein
LKKHRKPAGKFHTPRSKPEVKHYKYLTIGEGLAGDAAVRDIRDLNRDRSIGLFSMEPDLWMSTQG